MKHKPFKKGISLLLTLTILMTFATPVFADGKESIQKADIDLPGIDTNDAARSIAAGVGTYALNKLCTNSTLQSVANLGMNKALDALFGAGESETEIILKAIEGLSKQLDGISSKLEQMQAGLTMFELNTVLNSYREFITRYHVMYERLVAKQKEYADNPAMTKKLLLSIYDGNDANYRIGGDSFLILTQTLRGKLLEIKEVNGEQCNIFGAFDLLDKCKNKWEHQGYESRRAFRGAAIGIYIQFASLSKLACIAKMDDCKARGDHEGYIEAQSDYNLLIDDIKKVKEMVERCVVVEHPFLRIYRDTARAKDAYVFVDSIGLSEMLRDDDERYLHFLFDNSFGCYDYMFDMIGYDVAHQGPGNSGYEIISYHPKTSELKKIYDDYGGTKTLYDIFFDKNEGNFGNIFSLPKGTRFATDYYLYQGGRESILHLFEKYNEWKMDVVSDKGEINNIRLGKYYSKNWQSNSITTEKFFHIYKFPYPITQGDLKDPVQIPVSQTTGMISGMEDFYTLPYTGTVTLSVVEKAEATYQWYVDESGLGYKFVEIEGATDKTYVLPPLSTDMNGWMYRCDITEIVNPDDPDEIPVYTYCDPVTLNLIGEGIPVLAIVHNVGDSQDLKEALDKVSDGSWSGHILKLTNSILYESPITLNGVDVTFDLNEYTLTVQPNSTVEPNINHITDQPEIAAVYANLGSLNIIGEGSLDVVAGDNIPYGVYVYDQISENHYVTVSSVTSTGGGIAVSVFDGGSVIINGDVITEGDNACAIESFGGSVVINGNVTVNGNHSFGAYIESLNEKKAVVMIGSGMQITGDHSQAAIVTGERTRMTVNGDIIVQGVYASGIAAGGGNPDEPEKTCAVFVTGDVLAPYDPVNAYDKALINVTGCVTATEDYAVAVSSKGADVIITGVIESKGLYGTGINASAWDLSETPVGAFVTTLDQIIAHTPLRIESLPVHENEHTGELNQYNLYEYTDGISTVQAKPGAFDSSSTDAQSPVITSHPQDAIVKKDESVILSVQAHVSDGGTLSYQWYKNTTDDFTNGTPIEGATEASFTPATDTYGTTYYYAVVTNTNENALNNKTASVISRVAEITIEQTFIVTFDHNGGDTPAYPESVEVTSGGYVDPLPGSPVKSGYTFIGWNTRSDGSGIPFTASTPVTASITLYAQWRSNSSSPSTIITNPIEISKVETYVEGDTATATLTVTANIGINGDATAIISVLQANDAINKAILKAKEQGEGASAKVEIKVEANDETMSTEVTVMQASLIRAIGEGIDALTVTTPVASITFDEETLFALSQQTVGSIKISASYVDASSLDPDMRQTIGDKPIFDFTVSSNGKTISQFEGDVLVSVPYTLKEGEDPNAIVVYYISDSGQLETVTNGVYDPSTKTVRFYTNHFSKYTVGYHKVTFNDVTEDAWYYQAVSFIAARDILVETKDGNFNPNKPITRGQFLVMLMKAYGFTPDIGSEDNFSDAGDTYYTGYLAAAKRLKISSGVGNNLFAPDKTITRQEAFTLLYNMLNTAGKLPVGKTGSSLSAFTDSEEIADWAKEAMTVLTEAGIIHGNKDKLFPANVTTNAETAQILYRLLSE